MSHRNKLEKTLSKTQSQDSQQSRLSFGESKLCIIFNAFYPFKKGQLLLAKPTTDAQHMIVSTLTDIDLNRKVPNSFVKELLPSMVEEFLLNNEAYLENIISKLIEPDLKELIELAIEQLPLLFDPDIIPRCRERIIQLTVKIGKSEIVEFLFGKWGDVLNFRKVLDLEGNTLLHLAVIESNTETFLTILELANEFNFNNEIPQEKGLTNKPIPKLSRNNNIGQQHTLTDYIDTFNSTLHTALHLAVISHFLFAIEKLIQLGANVALSNNELNSIIHTAAAKNSTRSLKKILDTMQSTAKDGHLKWKQELHRKNSPGFIPVMLATEKSTIKILLDDYIPTEIVHEEHGYLIHWAVANNRTNLVILLLQQGNLDLQQENERGFTPLRLASRWGYKILTVELLKAGADPNFVGYSGVSCINNACQFGHFEIVDLLLQYGTELDSDEMEFTALHSAIMGGQLKVAKFLLETHQMDPNLIKSKGTPLHEAIKSGHTPCVKLLLKHGANPQLSFDVEGYKPIHTAIKNSQKHAVKLLLEFGAGADEAMHGGVTPAILAAHYDHVSILALLLTEGINLTKMDDSGNTLMHHIAMHQSYHCATYLLSRYSDAITNWEYSIYETKNFNDQTPIDIALSKQDEQILTQFISFTPREFFNQNPEIIHQLYDQKYFNIIRIIMSKMIITDSPNYVISTKFLESNSKGQYPEDPDFNHLDPTFLHKLRDCPDPEIKYHPILNVVVTEKLNLYNWWYILSFIVYVIFLVCLFYALIQASYICDNDLLYPNGVKTPLEIARLICEISVIIYGVFFAFSEIFEFGIEWHNTYKEKKLQHQLKSKLHIEKTFVHQKQMSDAVGEGIRRIFLNVRENINTIDRHSLYFFSSFISFYDAFNIFDSLSIIFLVCTIICRGIANPLQWTFASLTFIAFSLSLFKYTRIFPALGSYVQTIFRIYSIDIPRYAIIVSIFLVAFYGGMHLASRQGFYEGYNVRKPANACDASDILSDFVWFPNKRGEKLLYDNRLPLLAGLIFLLDGGPSEYQEDIFIANALLITVYLAFAFTIIVVMSNVLIAQLTQTYSEITKTDKFHYKIELVVTFELKSNLAFWFGKKARRLAAFDQMTIPLHLWNKIREDSPEKENELKISEILHKMGTESDVMKENSRRIYQMEEILDKLSAQLQDLSEDLVLIKNNIFQNVTEQKSDVTKQPILTRLPTTREGNIGSRIENIEQKLDRILLHMESK